MKTGANITSGNLFQGIIGFTVPLFIATLVQNLFTAADTVVVGNFADSLAVASIGAAAPVISLLVNCFVVFSGGVSIVVSKAIGANDRKNVNKTVDTALIFSAIFGVGVMFSALIFSTPLLKYLDCPEECFDAAVLYLRVYVIGIPATMIYSFASAIIRAEGDSKRPLIYIIISGIVNLATNLLLCLILENKVLAVAIATVLSQIVSAVLSMLRLTNKDAGYCFFSLKHFTFHGDALLPILRYGIPLALSGAIYPVANLQIQPAINSFGAANLAGFTASCNIDTLANALQSAFSTALVTFAAQNMGAHNKKRVDQTILICTACAFFSGLIIGLSATYLFSDTLLGWFLPDDPLAVFYAEKRMMYVTSFMWLSALFGCLASAIQVLGYPMVSTFNNLISVLGFRIIWMQFIYPHHQTIDMLYVCYTISWSILFVVGSVFFIYAYVKYAKAEKKYQLSQPQMTKST